jgi:hypothetical protein
VPSELNSENLKVRNHVRKDNENRGSGFIRKLAVVYHTTRYCRAGNDRDLRVLTDVAERMLGHETVFWDAIPCRLLPDYTTPLAKTVVIEST